uniref:Uncharacterized protein n=1 Tax=Meloidogyne hapla TaxID=6305 RepID=A0A1I8AYU4_MELHA
MQPSRISSLSKVTPRNNRAETRNKAKDELRRVIYASDKGFVRKCSVVAPKIVTPKMPNEESENNDETMQSAMSIENSNEENIRAMRDIDEEDSNAAVDFSDAGVFDSDSQTFDRIDYKNGTTTTGAIDFSGMRSREADKGQEDLTEDEDKNEFVLI